MSGSLEKDDNVQICATCTEYKCTPSMLSLNLNLEDKVVKSVLDKLPFLSTLLFLPGFFSHKPTQVLQELCWITEGHVWYNQH